MDGFFCPPQLKLLLALKTKIKKSIIAAMQARQITLVVKCLKSGMLFPDPHRAGEDDVD